MLEKRTNYYIILHLRMGSFKSELVIYIVRCDKYLNSYAYQMNIVSYICICSFVAI